jgi:hypothetical protein
MLLFYWGKKLSKRKRKTFFGQSYYNRNNLQVPNLRGLVYFFLLFLLITPLEVRGTKRRFLIETSNGVKLFFLKEKFGYKFSILIPVKEAKENNEWDIFSYKEVEKLRELLDRDFGSSTNTPEPEATQHPLLTGSYKMGNEMVLMTMFVLKYTPNKIIRLYNTFKS